MFTITIENLLHFHEYFDDKMISTKNFPLGFEKLNLLIYLVASLHKCGKIWKRKDRANILRHLESCHVASKCLVLSMSPRSKLYKWIACDCAAVKQQKKMNKTS